MRKSRMNGKDSDIGQATEAFAPWSCLSESELDELASLANQLRDGLKNLEK